MTSPEVPARLEVYSLVNGAYVLEEPLPQGSMIYFAARAKGSSITNFYSAEVEEDFFQERSFITVKGTKQDNNYELPSGAELKPEPGYEFTTGSNSIRVNSICSIVPPKGK